MKACPKCSGTQGYTLRVRTVGYVVHEGEWNGTHERIVDDSNMKLIGDKTVKCLDCGKRTLLKTLRALTLMLALFVLPLNAQVSQAKLDSVIARVEVLEQILGTKFNYPRPTSSIAADLIPANTLPTGQYPYILSDYQIRVGLEAFATKGEVGGLQAQLTGLASRLSVVEGTDHSGSASAPFAEGANLIVPGKIIVGDCDGGYPQLLQLCGQGNAGIRLSSNRNHQNNQGAEEHEHLIDGSADGGLRILFNWNCKEGEAATVDNGACWRNPNRPRRILGFDSMGTLSFSDDQYPRIDNSQTFVLSLDRASKAASWTLMKAGWHWELNASSCTNCFDKKYVVPQQ